MNEVNRENQNSENSQGFEESEYDIDSDNNGDSSDDTGDEQPRDELDVAEKNIVRLEQNSEDATNDESGEDGAEEEDAVQTGDDFSSDTIDFVLGVCMEILREQVSEGWLSKPHCRMQLKQPLKWELTGIPCKHGMSAIVCQGLNPEDFVHHCYMVDTYLAVYKPAIHAVNGPKLWAKAGFIPPLSPNFGRSVGKPSRARKLEPIEPTRKTKKKARGRKQPAKLSRQPYSARKRTSNTSGKEQLVTKKKKSDTISATTNVLINEDVPDLTVMEPIIMVPTPQLTMPHPPPILD
ncbi:UNVERIFIED_CONTAM: hypothetical protein Scaly_1604900 [Sesamum calycinum]|uniref:Zinc finger PMZ-type domain-containing protein n=1 Tax=Sesamum calycinum TaxID=2727403 RepID=A0AAW2P8D9_9LAMI